MVFSGYWILLLLIPFAQCGNLRGHLILLKELFKGNKLALLAPLSKGCSLMLLVANLWINHSGWDLQQGHMAALKDVWHPQFWDQPLFMDLEDNFHPTSRVLWGPLLQDIKDKVLLSNASITKDAVAVHRVSNHLWVLALVPNMEDIKGQRGPLIQLHNNLHLNYPNQHYTNSMPLRILCGHILVPSIHLYPFLLPNPTQPTRTSQSLASRTPLPLHFVNLLKVLKFLKLLNPQVPQVPQGPQGLPHQPIYPGPQAPQVPQAPQAPQGYQAQPLPTTQGQVSTVPASTPTSIAQLDPSKTTTPSTQVVQAPSTTPSNLDLQALEQRLGATLEKGMESMAASLKSTLAPPTQLPPTTISSTPTSISPKPSTTLPTTAPTSTPVKAKPPTPPTPPTDSSQQQQPSKNSYSCPWQVSLPTWQPRLAIFECSSHWHWSSWTPSPKWGRSYYASSTIKSFLYIYASKYFDEVQTKKKKRPYASTLRPIVYDP